MSVSLVEPAGRASVRPTNARDPATDIAVCLAATASLAHAVTTPEHWRAWPMAGWFFATLTLAQAVLAVWLFLGGRRLVWLIAAIAGHVAVIGLYVWSRTAGLPFGPGVSSVHGAALDPTHGRIVGLAERVGPLDYISLLAEVGLVVLLMSLLPGRWRSRVSSLMLVGGGALWALALSGLL
jgi:hypothetical protein